VTIPSLRRAPGRKRGGAGQSRRGRSSSMRWASVKVELRSGVVAVLRCTLMVTTGSWGTGDTRGVRGRSQVEEKPSVGRAHHEGWEDGSGGLGFGCWCFSCGSSQRRRGPCSMRGRRGVRDRPPSEGRTSMDGAHRGGERMMTAALILTVPMALWQRGWTRCSREERMRQWRGSL
jgi:hypothetical protein